jgi:hypothetical protein
MRTTTQNRPPPKTASAPEKQPGKRKTRYALRPGTKNGRARSKTARHQSEDQRSQPALGLSRGKVFESSAFYFFPRSQ